jgi:hypothetical protein
MPLSVSDGLSAWIKDFMKSDAPQFKGKTKEEIVKMAIAAYTDAGGKLKEEKMKNFKELREKFKVQTIKGHPRITDIYVQFRGGKGDRITSPENKRDFTSAVKMTLQFLKKNKLKSKPVFSTPEEGSSAYKVSLILNRQEEKTADLTPLANALAVLKTSEDHGMAWAKPVGESVNEKYRSKFPAELVAAAVKIAIDMGGNMTGAYKKIEAMKRGLANDPIVKDALRQANESVETSEDTQLDEAMKLKDIVRKHKSALMKAKRTGNLTLPQKAEDDLANWANNNGEIHGDDPDEFDDWLDSNIDDILRGKLKEGAFSVKLDKPYKRGDEKMYMDIIKKYGGKNLKYSPPKGRDPELDITFDGGNVKKMKTDLDKMGKGSWISEG